MNSSPSSSVSSSSTARPPSVYGTPNSSFGYHRNSESSSDSDDDGVFHDAQEQWTHDAALPPPPPQFNLPTPSLSELSTPAAETLVQTGREGYNTFDTTATGFNITANDPFVTPPQTRSSFADVPMTPVQSSRRNVGRSRSSLNVTAARFGASNDSFTAKAESQGYPTNIPGSDPRTSSLGHVHSQPSDTAAPFGIAPNSPFTSRPVVRGPSSATLSTALKSPSGRSLRPANNPFFASPASFNAEPTDPSATPIGTERSTVAALSTPTQRSQVDAFGLSTRGRLGTPNLGTPNANFKFPANEAYSAPLQTRMPFGSTSVPTTPSIIITRPRILSSSPTSSFSTTTHDVPNPAPPPIYTESQLLRQQWRAQTHASMCSAITAYRLASTRAQTHPCIENLLALEAATETVNQWINVENLTASRRALFMPEGMMPVRTSEGARPQDGYAGVMGTIPVAQGGVAVGTDGERRQGRLLSGEMAVMERVCASVHKQAKEGVEKEKAQPMTEEEKKAYRKKFREVFLGLKA